VRALCGFNDPQALARGYIDDLRWASGDYVQYEVVETLTVDAMPLKADGFQYSADEWLRCWQARGGWHEPDLVDYPALLRPLGAAERVARGEIDEVWLFSPPYSGFWESTMVGRGAYWCNSPPVEGLDCARRFVVMGFNFERGVGEMLEDFGHRVESILSRVYGPGRAEGGARRHAWDAFTAYEAVAPGEAGCGNVHFAPNSVRDYDWGNPTPVWSACDDWLQYPRRSGQRRLVDCREWGGGDIRAHHRWWLAHLPRAAGWHDGHLANWWTYAVDVNETWRRRG
jgi:hypothetical protein